MNGGARKDSGGLYNKVTQSYTPSTSILAKYGRTTLKRSLEEHNHLQTIESEEFHGTEGTVEAHLAPGNIMDAGNNPYQSGDTLKSLANVLSQGKRNP